MDTNNRTSPDVAVKLLGILHRAFVLGLVLFAGISVLLVSVLHFEPMFESSTVLRIIIVCVAAAGILLSQTLYKSKIATGRNATGMEGKINAYRSATILKYALIQGPALIAIILFLTTSDYVILIIGGILILWLIMQRPVQATMINELDIDDASLLQ